MLKRMILDQSKEKYKFPFPMKPKGICIHNTDNSASALNERNNLNRKENNDQVSFHVVTDEKESIQCIEFNRNAWAAGDGRNGEGNRNYIHWEIARNFHADPEIFAQAEERAAKDVAEELKARGWGIDRIKTHRDFSGKNCPSKTDIDKFKQKIQAYLLNMINKPISDSAISVGSKVRVIGNVYATGQRVPSWVKENIYTIQQISGDRVLLKEIESWVYLKDIAGVSQQPKPVEENNIIEGVVTASALNVRDGNGTEYKILGTLQKGTKVKIDKRYSKPGWYSIYYGDHGGFVSEKYIKIV